MKYLSILLILLSISCGGKGGEGRIRVFLEDKNGFLVKQGDVSIVYNTKKVNPKKDYNQTVSITKYKSTFEGLKRGYYTIMFEGDKDTDKCAVNLRLIYESERTIWLRSGKFEYLSQ